MWSRKAEWLGGSIVVESRFSTIKQAPFSSGSSDIARLNRLTVARLIDSGRTLQLSESEVSDGHSSQVLREG